MDERIWHDDDDFWGLMAPFMFGEQSWEQAPVQVEQIISLLNMAPGSVVLDCPCGPGRHTLEFARRGYRITGVDRTQSYLAEAQSRAAAEDLAPELLHDDMRRFSRPDTYDVALSLFTSFGYFDDPADNQRVLLNYYRSLKAGGVLLMDMSGKEVIARTYQQRDWREHDGVYLLEERNVAAGWTRMNSRWILIKDGVVHEKPFTHWIYSAGELGQMLAGCGFQRVSFYGDLEGAAYDNDAKRLIAVAYR